MQRGRSSRLSPERGSARTGSAVLGEMGWLLTQSSQQEQVLFLCGLEWMPRPPILQQQFVYCWATDKPIAASSHLNDEVEHWLLSGSASRTASLPTISGSSRCWPPFGGAAEMLNHLKSKVFRNRRMRFGAVVEARAWRGCVKRGRTFHRRRCLWFLAFAVLGIVRVSEPAAQSFPPRFQSQSPKVAIGDVVIVLGRPSLETRSAAQQHLVFANVLSLIVMDALPILTGGDCRTVVAPSSYPNLRAYLFSNVRSQDQPDRLANCLLALQTIAVRHPVQVDDILKVANELMLRAENVKHLANTSGPIRFDLFLRAGLAQAYLADTLMHALLAIDERSYREIHAQGVLEWLTQLRRNNQIGLSALERADSPDLTRFGVHAIRIGPAPPPSLITGDRPIRVRSLGKTFPPVLAVRHYAHEFERVQLPASKKYCNQSLEIPSYQDVAAPKLRIGCFSESLFGVESWLALYIDDTEQSLDVKRATAFLLNLAKDPVFQETTNARDKVVIPPIVFISE
jgi:hypothetical protein